MRYEKNFEKNALHIRYDSPKSIVGRYRTSDYTG